mgnify:CR=1 FL=1
MSIQPKEVAKAALASAKKSGATEAEAFIVSNRELNVGIRDGRAESVKQSDARGLGLRVIVDGKAALVYTSDFRPEAVATLAERAVALARHSESDPANRLADPAPAPAKLETFDPAVAALTPDKVIAMGVAAEKVARGVDPRIKSTQFGGAGASHGETWVINSRGLETSYPRSVVSVFIGVLADDADGKKRNGNDGSAQRFLADLRPPEAIGREAGQARRAHGRREEGRHPEAAGADASRHRRQLDPEHVQRVLGRAGVQEGVVPHREARPDRGLAADHAGRRPAAPRALGGVPYDDEGVPTRKVTLLEKGVVKGFVYNLRWAQKAGAASTGHATRGYTSVPFIGPHSVYIENGATPVEEMIRGIDHGFYLTDTGAFGYDPATGGWSYQASGLMIEKGALGAPVTDVSLASDTLAMLKGVQKVGNDLVFDGPINAPHLLIDEMALSGT